jgi:hypothetical protein
MPSFSSMVGSLNASKGSTLFDREFGSTSSRNSYVKNSPEKLSIIRRLSRRCQPLIPTPVTPEPRQSSFKRCKHSIRHRFRTWFRPETDPDPTRPSRLMGISERLRWPSSTYDELSSFPEEPTQKDSQDPSRESFQESIQEITSLPAPQVMERQRQHAPPDLRPTIRLVLDTDDRLDEGSYFSRVRAMASIKRRSRVLGSNEI